MYNLSNIYKYYVVVKEGTLSKEDFKNICCDFNIHIWNKIIYDAAIVSLGHNLSTLSISRIKRGLKNRRIDWKASNEYKKELLAAGEKLYDDSTGEGKKWFIYEDNMWYCRIYWQRKFAKVTNKSAYKFIATRGRLGNKTKLKNHLNKDSINYIKYRHGNIQHHIV